MFYIIYIILCVLVAMYANSKGRSGIGYFFVALFLSPLIGVIIALLVSPITDTVEAKAIASGNMRKCPHCAELIKAEAKICKHCHSDLSNHQVKGPVKNQVKGPVKSIEQLKKATGHDAIRFAFVNNSEWTCVCGRRNNKGEQTCLNCERDRDFVLENYQKA